MDKLKSLASEVYYNKLAILFKTKILSLTLQILSNSLRGSSTVIFICKVLAVHH